MPRRRPPVAALAVLVLAAGCGGSTDPETARPRLADRAFAEAVADLSGPATYGTPRPGGVFRVAGPDLGLSAGLDPTAEYTGFGWSVLRGLMVRPLLSHPFTAGDAGDALRPDLAEAPPEVSADGRTYTLRIRPGVRFGPPVSREVTSRDVAAAFRRIGTPSVAAQYAFHFDVIAGMTEFREGRARGIRGIATPDDRTIRITLTAPTPDFPQRLALPATAPVPPEVADCHTGPAEYGRYVVSTGPYMIAGSDRIPATCAAPPPAGFDPGQELRLVRNPVYDPATDDRAARPSLPDGFAFTVDANAGDIGDRIERGLLEAGLLPPTPKVLRRHVGSDRLRSRLRVNPGASVGFLAMNLTEPPFDDVHVRRALGMAIDLDGLRRARGGVLTGPIATHALPDPVLDLGGETFLQAPPFTGDPAGAAAEMARSRYDTDADGRCDAPVCEDVLMVTDSGPPASLMTPGLVEAAASIGLRLRVRAVPFGTGLGLVGTPSRRVALTPLLSWSKDFDDPSTFIGPLFTSAGIAPGGSTNVTMLGITPRIAAATGVRLPAGGVPSVDAEAAACAAASGTARRECYADLDRHLMRDIVPWVPLLQPAILSVLGPAVTAYDLDEASGTIAWSRVAVDPALQR